MRRFQPLIRGILFVLVTATLGGAWGADGQIDLLPPGGSTALVVDQPGSYVLVGGAAMTDANIDCIQIAADDVVIDLNGHTLSGANAVGSGCGIRQTSGSGLRISGGNIRFFGGDGLQLGPSASLVDVISRANLGSGIIVGANSSVTSSLSYSNAEIGIDATSSIVRGCLSKANGTGIRVVGSTVTECAVLSGQGVGIESSGSSILNNLIRGNQTHGVAILNSSGSLVKGNAITGNGLSAVDGAGIFLDGTSTLNRIEENNASLNLRGIEMASALCTGNIVIRNAAFLNSDQSYVFVTGNLLGPLSADPTTTTNSWANFN